MFDSRMVYRMLLVPYLLYAFSVSATEFILDMSNRDDIPLLSKALFLDVTSTASNIIAVGERGHILISQDSRQWKVAEVPVDATLTSVYFHNEMIGWAAGHDAVILRTTDGGHKWRSVYTAPEDESPLLDIWFADEHFGIAVGAYGLYVVSTDGGDTWEPHQMKIVNDLDSSAVSTDLAESYDLHLNSISYSASGKLYIAAEAGRIYRSDDLGRHWKELPSPYEGSYFGILPLGNESLLVFGLRGHLYRSDDAGENWVEINSGSRELLTSGIHLQDGRILLTGMGGTLLVSNDQGHNFRHLDAGHRHSYAAATVSGKETIILVGDHGLESWTMQQPGIPDD